MKASAKLKRDDTVVLKMSVEAARAVNAVLYQVALRKFGAVIENVMDALDGAVGVHDEDGSFKTEVKDGAVWFANEPEPEEEEEEEDDDGPTLGDLEPGMFFTLPLPDNNRILRIRTKTGYISISSGWATDLYKGDPPLNLPVVVLTTEEATAIAEEYGYTFPF